MNGKPVNGFLRLLLATGVLVALIVLGFVWNIYQDNRVKEEELQAQRSEILNALRTYDSLSAIRLLHVAKQAHPNKQFYFPKLDTAKIKTILEKGDSAREAKK